MTKQKSITECPACGCEQMYIAETFVGGLRISTKTQKIIWERDWYPAECLTCNCKFTYYPDTERITRRTEK